MLTLIENGEVYAPEPRGRQSVLLVDGKIGKIGDVSPRDAAALGLELEVVDATGCVVTPGFIDPHQHLLGGSGERGLSTQSPMLFLTELVAHGVTTVVGTLGVDTTMKTMAGLLARVKGLEEEGLSAFMWSGGYNVPLTTVMGSIREDMLFIDEVIGAGEVAISDARAIHAAPEELAKLIIDTHVGGILSAKAGVTHFHVGDGKHRLRPVCEVLERFDIEPRCLYPGHVQRNERLLDEAIALTKRGVCVDFDTTEEDLGTWLPYYVDNGGDLDRLTISSDADSGTPKIHYEQWCRMVLDRRYPLERMLPLVTSNVARVLRLERKGRLDVGCDGDVLVLRAASLEIVEVIAKGRRMVKDGEAAVSERFLEKSKRNIHLVGKQWRA